MTRTVAAGQFSNDIQQQIEAKLASSDVVPAQVQPGIVPGTEPRKGRPKRDQTDIDLDADRKVREEAFEKVAREKIAESDKQTGALANDLQKRTQPRRGLLLDEPEEKERDSAGKFVAAAETETDDEPAAETDETETDDEEPTAPAKMTHAKALALLRLDGFKSKALEKLSPEEAIELASHRATVRTGVEQMASELATLKKAAATTPKAPESTTATPATGAPTFDVKNATKRFRETYGEKEAETLEETATALSSFVEGRIDAEKKAFAPLANAVRKLQLDFARTRLERVYPELGDDAVFGRVMKQVAKTNLEAYSDIGDVLQDAATVVLAKLKKGVSTDADRAARKRGQPATGSRRETPLPMSRHDAFGELAVAIESGDTDAVERIKRLI